MKSFLIASIFLLGALVSVPANGSPLGNLEIISINYDSLSMSWTAKNEPNRQIHGYIVTLLDSGSTLETFKTNLHVLKRKFINLEPFRMYTVEVCSYSMDGNVTQKGSCDQVSRNTSVAAPSTPTDFTIYEVRAKEVLIFWTEPDRLNGPLDGYILEWGKMANNKTTDNWKRKIYTDLRILSVKDVVEGLEPYTSYHFRVSAFNLLYHENGSVHLLIGKSVDQFQRTRVAAPTIPKLEVHSVGDNFVKLSWKSPKILNGPLDGYLLYWKFTECPLDEASCMNEVSLDSEKESHVIKNLLCCHTYKFGLMAYNLDKNKKLYSRMSTTERRTSASAGTSCPY